MDVTANSGINRPPVANIERGIEIAQAINTRTGTNNGNREAANSALSPGNIAAEAFIPSNQADAPLPIANSAAANQPQQIASDSLGKDDFLRILITQLQNQNPISPVEDKEFIAQLAQFSSLEQITNLSSSFNTLAQSLNSDRGLSLLGRTVEINDNGTRIRGTVSNVSVGDNPQITVGSQAYDLDAVLSIGE